MAILRHCSGKKAALCSSDERKDGSFFKRRGKRCAFLRLFLRGEPLCPLISAQNLTFGYEGSSDLVFDNVSFQVDTDWKLGLVGRNGRGKTTLLRLLTGELTGSGELQVPMPCTYFPYPVQSRRKTD